ncbi:hypothetical protein [Butyrivibrio sp. JL13D10]|uniref:hypothetical protein n=1 Tax=Butyrivibrio sp. JL13D10 TaxID=3236815 RepID=UPI0038B4658A
MNMLKVSFSKILTVTEFLQNRNWLPQMRWKFSKLIIITTQARKCLKMKSKQRLSSTTLIIMKI